MQQYTLNLALAAKTDLKNIYQYGLRQWGKAQANGYLDTIKTKLWTLSEQPKIGISRLDLGDHTRSLSLKHHTIYYQLNDDSVEILRILHNRQDSSQQFR